MPPMMASSARKFLTRWSRRAKALILDHILALHDAEKRVRERVGVGADGHVSILARENAERRKALERLPGADGGAAQLHGVPGLAGHQ